jgi:hypothetical protein
MKIATRLLPILNTLGQDLAVSTCNSSRRVVTGPGDKEVVRKVIISMGNLNGTKTANKDRQDKR